MSTSLFMRRPTLERLPDLPQLPAGYALRTCTQSDCTALGVLLSRAFGYLWDEEKVRRDLIDADDVKEIFLVTYEDRLVATASARLMPDLYPGSGYVHWVGVDPLSQGQGLGRFVSLRVLQYFRDADFRDAVLETDDFRTAAVRTYLRLGFVPACRDPREEEQWMDVLPRLFS